MPVGVGLRDHGILPKLTAVCAQMWSRLFPRALPFVLILLALLVRPGAPACAAAGAPSARAPAGAPFVMAIGPYLSAAEVHHRFGPLARHLEGQLGHAVTIAVGNDYEEHIRVVGRDAVDLAFVGPSSYVHVVDRYGAKPLLARVEKAHRPVLEGVIFVRQDSALHSLDQLRGRRFAFGDPDSTTGSVLARYALQKSGVTLDLLGSYRHVSSSYDVVMGVLAGDFDAGAINRDLFDAQAAKGLRVLAPLPAVSEGVFVARSDLPAEQVARLRMALLQVADAPDGPAILHAISAEMTGLGPVKDSDFDGLRTIMRSLPGGRD